MDALKIYEGEEAAYQGVSEHHSYKRHTLENIKRWLSYRSFAGVNTFLVGDFYQLPPVGGTPIMGNPYCESVLANESVQNIMSRIWQCIDEPENPNALQLWTDELGQVPSRVLDFKVNQRSGDDRWFADLLTSCREGNMKDDDYLFLHGLPTVHCGSWLPKEGKSLCGNHACELFPTKTKKLRSKTAGEWLTIMFASKQEYECKLCSYERKRRHRVLWSEPFATRNVVTDYDMCGHLQEDLRSDRYKEALYIQMANETVGNYAFNKARLFAEHTGAQLLWVQAEDYLDDPHFADLTQEKKKERKRQWLNPKYNFRRTGCIPTLLPLCYDLPLRVMHGNYGGQSAELKAHGVYNQSKV